MYIVFNTIMGNTPPYASGIGMKWGVLNGINFAYNKKGF